MLYSTRADKPLDALGKLVALAALHRRAVVVRKICQGSIPRTHERIRCRCFVPCISKPPSRPGGISKIIAYAAKPIAFYRRGGQQGGLGQICGKHRIIGGRTCWYVRQRTAQTERQLAPVNRWCLLVVAAAPRLQILNSYQRFLATSATLAALEHGCAISQPAADRAWMNAKGGGSFFDGARLGHDSTCRRFDVF